MISPLRPRPSTSLRRMTFIIRPFVSGVHRDTSTSAMASSLEMTSSPVSSSAPGGGRSGAGPDPRHVDRDLHDRRARHPRPRLLRWVVAGGVGNQRHLTATFTASATSFAAGCYCRWRRAADLRTLGHEPAEQVHILQSTYSIFSEERTLTFFLRPRSLFF